MVLLGLSVLVISLSFLCYRHPPHSWPIPTLSFLPTWLRIRLSQAKAPPSVVIPDDMDGDDNGEEDFVQHVPAATHPPGSDQQTLDGRAMPPPPPPLPRRSEHLSPQTTPKARATQPSTAPIPPLPALDDDAPPSFPAPGSAQRARGPPKLSAVSSSRGRGGGDLAAPRPSAASSLRIPQAAPAPLPGASSTTRARKKVVLAPNHSPLDWASLQATLAPRTPLLRVPPSQLRQHASRQSAWTVLGGTVYDVTPYLPFHPGGERELLRAAGRDGSKLFAEIHPWVNWEGMLGGCVVGIAVGEHDRASEKWEEMD